MIPNDFFQQTHNYLIILAGLAGLIVGLITNSEKLMNHFSKRITARGLNQVEEEDLKKGTFIGESLNAEERLTLKLDEIIRIVNENTGKIQETKVLQKRQEILQLVESQPCRIESIEKSYDEYKRLGGNSYIDDVIMVWRNTTAKNEIKNRITKKKE